MWKKKYQIRSWEIGLLFRDGELAGILEPGDHRVVDFTGRVAVEVVSTRQPWLEREDLDLLVASGHLAERLEVIDLGDAQRALAWVDGRFAAILGPGLHAAWKGPRALKIEVVDASSLRFAHAQLVTILRHRTAQSDFGLSEIEVSQGHVGLAFVDGELREFLQPGRHAYWKGLNRVRLVQFDVRETAADISGQELMTADRVTLRLNAVVTYKVVDVARAVASVHDYQQVLYRDAQLALRAVVGGRELDALLADKDEVSRELEQALRKRAAELGVEVIGLGIRDVILPGDMKELLNKVTEARKAAEAAVITRREETAAMRSQANAAKLLADNPTLMRLRELEVLEKVAASSKLNVVLGDKGLAERVVNLL